MRAHLARAFAVDAPVLLVDEPIASLDPYHQLHVMQLLGERAWLAEHENRRVAVPWEILEQND